MKKSDLTGWKNVFAFTFIQHYKSKAAKIALVLLSLTIICFGPIMSIVGSKGAEQVISNIFECKIEKIYVRNLTEFIFDPELFKQEYDTYKNVEFIATDDSLDTFKESFKKNSENNLILDISFDEISDNYKIVVYKSEKSAVDMTVTEIFSENVSDFFYDGRVRQLGIDDAANELINTDVSVETIDISDISDKYASDDEFNPIMMSVIVLYAAVVMIISIVSSQQIAVSIIVEKTSKVVETIMVSVKPLALVVGKILGTMCILVCDFVVILISGGISVILSAVVSSRQISETMQGMAQKFSEIDTFGTPSADLSSMPQINITPERILLGIVVIFITTIIAYLFYSVLAGIVGASCGSMEDLQSASTFTVISCLAGMYISMFVPIVNSDAFTAFAKVFPFSGIYVVPVYFIFAKASIWSVLLNWVEMLVLTVLLFRFAARIYHVLLFHKGERFKLKNLIGLSKSQKGKVR